MILSRSFCRSVITEFGTGLPRSSRRVLRMLCVMSDWVSPLMSMTSKLRTAEEHGFSHSLPGEIDTAE